MMQLPFLAALATLAQGAVAPPPVADLSFATPLGGNWSYAATADGSEANFIGAGRLRQLTIHCARATRRVSLAKPAAAAAPFLQVWTSSQSRNLPAGFDSASAKLSATLAAFDPLLDAMIGSRGRFGVGLAGQPPLVLPPWAEVARVVEDCRA